MTDAICLPIRLDVDVVTARQLVREMASRIGFAGSDLTLIATAVSEITRNIIVYAGHGELSISAIEGGRRGGILIVARDQGGGIADVDMAMQDGYSTANSLGLGLPGARRMMDEFEVVSTVGVGTTVTMRKWIAR